jgi:eukaryotic-like serine/threonine-protein kinase
MTAQVIQRDKLGALTKIAQGGQGVVYRAPKVKTKFAASMVYKEYKAQTLGQIDYAALAAMPALVEDSLSYKDAERLISIAAWPCALIEDGGASKGFVMPAIPDEFFISLTTVKGVSNSSSEFQHLLNHYSVLQARGIDIDDAQRYTLLREVASGLEFLHRQGVCVGDISPKNLLFSLSPHEAIYFIDCDAMRINGVSVLPQVETPGWEAPAGEELATIYTDTYKLGLLALRLLVGDHDTKNPQHLPPDTPDQLRQIITDTLKNQPHSRPLPQPWTYVLGNAIEEAQHRKNTTAAAAPGSPAAEPPPEPIVHTRPSTRGAQSRPPTQQSRPPAPAPVPSTPPPPPRMPPPNTSNSPNVKLLVGIGAVIVALVVIVMAIQLSKGGSSSTTPTTVTISAGGSSPFSYSNTPSYTPTTSTWSPPANAAPPALEPGPDGKGATCPGGYFLNSQSGWATHSGRGTHGTTCQFASNVLNAYWNMYSTPGPDTRQISVAGSVPCPQVAGQCDGNNFIMTCAVNGSDTFITCRGGNEAVVYLW